MHRYQVLVPDYLTDVELEKSLLGDIADITPLALSRDEEFVPHAHKADALLLYHDIGIGQAAIAKMDRCRGIVRCGVGFNNRGCCRPRDYDAAGFAPKTRGKPQCYRERRLGARADFWGAKDARQDPGYHRVWSHRHRHGLASQTHGA